MDKVSHNVVPGIDDMEYVEMFNLDPTLANDILVLLKELNSKSGITIVMVTHEPWHTKYVSRVIKLKDGKIIQELRKRG